jgi:hypothetical protein
MPAAASSSERRNGQRSEAFGFSPVFVRKRQCSQSGLGLCSLAVAALREAAPRFLEGVVMRDSCRSQVRIMYIM